MAETTPRHASRELGVSFYLTRPPELLPEELDELLDELPELMFEPPLKPPL
jgi:hypothetical protein